MKAVADDDGSHQEGIKDKQCLQEIFEEVIVFLKQRGDWSPLGILDMVHPELCHAQT